MSETDPNPTNVPTPRRPSWPLALAIVAVAIMVIGAASLWLVLRTAKSMSTAALDSGREVLGDLESIARAFRTGTIHTTFTSHATQVAGNSYLQFATLDEVEVFERTDRAAALWGQLQLPDVVVRATAPVQYTYYLDFDEPWRFELVDDRRIRVIAPRIRSNRPSIDVSRLQYEVRADSLLRDEEKAKAALGRGLASMARRRAAENVQLVREIGRRKTEDFVENWLFRDFGEAARQYDVEVTFADEPEAILSDPLVIEGATRTDPGDS